MLNFIFLKVDIVEKVPVSSSTLRNNKSLWNERHYQDFAITRSPSEPNLYLRTRD